MGAPPAGPLSTASVVLADWDAGWARPELLAAAVNAATPQTPSRVSARRCARAGTPDEAEPAAGAGLEGVGEADVASEAAAMPQRAATSHDGAHPPACAAARTGTAGLPRLTCRARVFATAELGCAKCRMSSGGCGNCRAWLAERGARLAAGETHDSLWRAAVAARRRERAAPAAGDTAAQAAFDAGACKRRARAVALALRAALLGDVRKEADRLAASGVDLSGVAIELRLCGGDMRGAGELPQVVAAWPHCPRTADCTQRPATVMRRATDGDEGVEEEVVLAGPPAAGCSALARAVGVLADLAWAMCAALRKEGAVPSEDTHDDSKAEGEQATLKAEDHHAPSATVEAAAAAEESLPPPGTWVRVFWETDSEWYVGLVQTDPRTGYYRVFYPEDGHFINHRPTERWEALSELPAAQHAPPPVGEEVWVWEGGQWQAGVVSAIARDGDGDGDGACSVKYADGGREASHPPGFMHTVFDPAEDNTVDEGDAPHAYGRSALKVFEWSWDVVFARARAILAALPAEQRTLQSVEELSLRGVVRASATHAPLLAEAVGGWCAAGAEAKLDGWGGARAATLAHSLLRFLQSGGAGATAARMPIGARAWGGILPLPGDNLNAGLEGAQPLREARDDTAFVAAYLAPGERDARYVLLPPRRADVDPSHALVLVRADATTLLRQSRLMRDAPVFFVTGEEVPRPPAAWLRPHRPLLAAQVGAHMELGAGAHEEALVCRLYERDTSAVLDLPAYVYERCGLEPPVAPPPLAPAGKFALLDLFAGVGGLAAGALDAGCFDGERMCFVEKDERLTQVLRQLFPDAAKAKLVTRGDVNAFLLEVADAQVRRRQRCQSGALANPSSLEEGPSAAPRTALAQLLRGGGGGARAAAEHVAEWSAQRRLVLAAGPPCPGFSGLNQHPDGVNAIEARAGVAALADAVELLRPEYVVMENVLELSAAFEEYLAAVAGQLLCVGYQLVAWQVHYASFGAASRRKRLFVVAGRSGAPLPAPPAPTHHGEALQGAGVRTVFVGAPHPELSEAAVAAMRAAERGEPSALAPLVTAAEAAAGLGRSGEPRGGGEIGRAHCPRALSDADTARISALPLAPGSCYADLPREVRDAYPIGRAEAEGPDGALRAKIVLGRVYADRLSPSFTKMFSTQGFVGRVVHWSEPRILTPAEAWRFLGFKREAIARLEGPLNTLYEAAANAVSPLATRAIFVAIGQAARGAAPAAGARGAAAPARVALPGTSRAATMWGGYAERPAGGGARRLAGCGGGRVAAGALKAKLPPGWEVFYEAIKSGKGAAEGREDIKVRAPDGTVYRSIVSAVRAIEAGHAGDAASAGAGGRRLSQKHFEGAHFLNALQEGLVAGSAVDARLVPVAFAGGGAGFAEQSDSDDDRGGDDGAGGEGGGGGCQSGGGGGGGLPLAAPPGGWRRRRGAVADVGGGAPATKRPRCCHR